MPLNDIDLIDEKLLPPVTRKLARIIGMAETINLLQKRGGIPTRMPVNADASHPVLSGILTADAITALANSELAGKLIEMPKPDKALQQLRNLAIAADRKKYTATTVARRYGLTRRMVIIINNEVGQDDDQHDLFACDQPE